MDQGYKTRGIQGDVSHVQEYRWRWRYERLRQEHKVGNPYQPSARL